MKPLLLAAVCVLLQSAAISQELARRPEAAVERYENANIELGSVRDARGNRLRTLITVPRSAGRRPGILLAGWLSCDSVELRPGARDGVSRLLSQIIAESDAVLMRVDKPGVGDSEGNCRETDFETELSGYRAAFVALRTHSRVDPARITVLGISNGGGFAPLVANGAPVAGYVTVGGWSKTWFEHMIELERRRLPLAGTAPRKINAAMKLLTQLHAEYLFEQRTPGQVIAAHPNLKQAWYDEPAHQYGRPAVFYHQLQALDLGAAWARVNVPALVVWGEYDWIMSRDDQTSIVNLVNANAPGRARLLIVPRMDHSFSTHASAKEAFDRMGAGDYPAEAAAEIIAFLRNKTR